MRTLSTCAVCGGTIERRPTAVAGWGHVTETARNADGHQPRPDDGAVSGPGSDDEESRRCHDCGRVPRPGERHGLLDGVTDDGEPLGFTCLDADDRVIYDPPPSAGPSVPDPWFNPDAASANQPPPF